MIVKNEIANITKLMDSVCPILEEVVVVDTGSTDGTLEELKSLSTKYKNLRLESFTWNHNFSDARNYSFSLATKSWVFWVDGDDQLNQANLKKFKDSTLDNNDVDAWMLEYIYSSFPDGRPQTILGRERFLRRSKNPKWIGAIHETVDISNFRSRDFNDLKITHNRGGKIIEPRRNLKILEKEYEKNPNDPRTAYYYGKELFDHIDPKGIEVLEKYINSSGFRYYDDEVNARFRLARHYVSVGKLTEAITCADRIYHIDQTRERAEYYWIYGVVESQLKNWKIAAEWFNRCLRTPPPPPRVLNLEFYTWHPHKKLAVCYLNLKDYVQVEVHIGEVLKILPGDTEAKSWAEGMREVVVDTVGGLKVVEVLRDDKPQIRSDSTTIKHESFHKWLPYKKDSLDGAVAPHLIDPLMEAVKPGGFYWLETDSDQLGQPLRNFGCLGVTDYNGRKIRNYIKEDPNLPKFFISPLDRNFGPTRIRLYNLYLSLVKVGYPISYSQMDCDYFVSSKPPQTKIKGKVILDICERLPISMYAGLHTADLIVVCSEDLKKYLREHLSADKSIVVVDDHFEMSARDWL